MKYFQIIQLGGWLSMIIILLILFSSFVFAEYQPTWKSKTIMSMWHLDDGVNNETQFNNTGFVLNIEDSDWNTSTPPAISNSDYSVFLDADGDVLYNSSITLTFNLSHSICFWYYPLIHPLDNDYVMVFSVDASNSIYSWFESDKLYWSFKGGGSDDRVTIPDTHFVKDRWTHLCLVKSGKFGGSNMSVYVNGTSIATTDVGTPAGATSVTGAGAFYFGSYNDVDAYTLQSNIDDLIILNESLTADEVISIYQDSYTAIPIPSDYNVTSGYGDTIAWRTDVSVYVNTTDNTSTVTFSTDINANCTIGKNDYNYTTMIADDPNTACATNQVGGLTSHTCTIPTSQNVTAGNNTIYISCLQGATGGGENFTSSSGALNLYYNKPPEIPTLSSPANDSSETSTPVSLVYSSSDENNDTIQYFVWTKNGSNNYTLSYTGNLTSYSLTVADGETWHWKVGCDDGVTNTSNSTNHEFTATFSSGAVSTGGGGYTAEDFEADAENPTCENLYNRLGFLIPKIMMEFHLEMVVETLYTFFDWVMCEGSQLEIIDVEYENTQMIE